MMMMMMMTTTTILTNKKAAALMSVLHDARDIRQSGAHIYLFIYTVLTIIRGNG
jgi:hypothetical protein